MKTRQIAIIGTGNIGSAIARGLLLKGYQPERIYLTRRKVNLLSEFQAKGFKVGRDNTEAVRHAEIVFIAVEPQQIDTVLDEIRPDLMPERHLLVSVVSNVGIRRIKEIVGESIRVVRAMPNTAISIAESMTCLTADGHDREALQEIRAFFSLLGSTLIIDEDQMTAATALGACGIAFFLRAIRAASQGGIEIGFHADEALKIAAQTARGAASLLLTMENHPESEIDRVTTPRGCTISGLNQMEHAGFSSALIKGIIVSAEKASKLYKAAHPKPRTSRKTDERGEG